MDGGKPSGVNFKGCHIGIPVVIAVAAAVVLLNPSEPRVQGKRVSDWLDQIEYRGNVPGVDLSHLDPAFVALTNGGPEIAKPLAELWLAGHNEGAAARIGDQWKDLFAGNKGSRARVTRGWRAWYVLVHMGRKASNAAPTLIKALDHGPWLQRCEAALGLGRIGAMHQRAAPALIENLGGTDEAITWITARSLGFFGDRARSALPKLEELRTNKASHGFVRVAATAAICRIDAEQSEDRMDDLIAELRKPSAERVSKTPSLLGDMGGFAERAVPALIEIIDQGVSGQVSRADERAAWRALKDIDPVAHELEYRKRGGDVDDRPWNRRLLSEDGNSI